VRIRQQPTALEAGRDPRRSGVRSAPGWWRSSWPRRS